MNPTAVRALLVAAAVAYLFAFGRAGLSAHLTGDDLMNAYQYWSRPLSRTVQQSVLFFPADVPRPIAAFFYLPLLAVFGLNPLPYRIICVGLIAVNVGLMYCFCLRLSRSKEIAVL